MAYDGPTFTGTVDGYQLLDGGTYRLLTPVQISDASSQQISLTITVSDTGVGALFDPNSASDGSTYDSGTGVYSVSGTTASVSAAIEGLEFLAPANPSSRFAFLEFAATDGAGNLNGPAPVIQSYSGTTYVGGGHNISLSAGGGPPVALILSATNGNPDVISYAGPGATEFAVAALDDAQATIDVACILYVSAGDSVTLGSGYVDSAFGDGGVYALDGATLTIVGNASQVSLSGSAANSVSFWGPAGGADTETVAGSNGIVIENDVQVTLAGDDDTIYFDPSDDVLNLSAATLGAWNTLYATSGVVNLNGASLSVFGGGVTVNAVSGDDSVSLYQTNHVADTIHGDGVTVTLNNAQASLDGVDDTIWFVGSSASTVTLNLQAGQTDTVYGAGTIDLAGGTVTSFGGGALVNFQAAGETAHLSSTGGEWDRVQGAAGTIVLKNAQAVVVGGNQTINLASHDDDAATLTQTNGAWDSVYGSGQTLNIVGAQANIYGSFDDVYLSGASAEVSFYQSTSYYGYSTQTVFGSNATIITDVYDIVVDGGADAVYLNPSFNYGQVTITDTKGVWDAVYEQYQYLYLYDAQSSVFGGGNGIYMGDARNAVSLYDTAGVDDSIYEGGGAVTLNNAQANLWGTGYFVYFGGAANVLDLTYGTSDDLLTFIGSIGQDSVQGFISSDSIAVSQSRFANFQAFEAAFTQVGADAVLTLDANDKVTFVGLQTSAVAQTQVKFV